MAVMMPIKGERIVLLTPPVEKDELIKLLKLKYL